jgi:uncharacterized protein (DUF1810 family)
MNDPFDLQRFIDAQAPTHQQALAELQAGRKQSHWMWYVFPQLAGLGNSDMARRYGISGRDEALAYWQHSVLGDRLARCCEALLEWQGRSATQIMGSPDDMKLRSSMTLFAAVAPDQLLFRAVLEAFFEGKPDAVTLSKLG